MASEAAEVQQGTAGPEPLLIGKAETVLLLAYCEDDPNRSAYVVLV